MYGFTVQWQSRDQLPQIPPQMLFAGVARKARETEEVLTPMIGWAANRAYVFDDRLQHQHAWLVVYGKGGQITGAHQLTDFRHIHDITESANGVALDLHDASGRWVEIQHLLLQSLVGQKFRDEGPETLPVGIPFCLSNGHDVLTVDEGGARISVAPDASSASWMFKDGRLTHLATRKVLGMGIRPLPAAQEEDRWHLSPEGELRYGNGQRGLAADPVTGEVWLQLRGEAAPTTQWQVKWPEVARVKTSGLLVSKLEIHVQVADEYRAGTSDKIYFSINGSRVHQYLADNFEYNAALLAVVDLPSMFPGQAVFADDLDTIELYQESVGGYGPAWRMQSMDLVVNDHMINRVLGSDSPWLLPGEGANWIGKVNWLDWRQEQGTTPLDYAGYTYPVNWKPAIADWLAWRSYDPENIDGICQLIGVFDGQVLAYDLKGKHPVYLKPNTDNDAYTWVYTPQGSIIVKHWDKAASRDHYVRHSQLGAGKPVVCAGELTIRREVSHLAVLDLLGMINDASGHYQPDGGACLGHVLERLAQLGFDTSVTQVHTRNGPFEPTSSNKEKSAV